MLSGLHIQVQMYINYYSVSLGCCVPQVVFIYRFHCTSDTKVCPLGGLYIQVPLYIRYYSVSLGWSLYTGSTVHQLLRCVPWVVFIYRFQCTYVHILIKSHYNFPISTNNFHAIGEMFTRSLGTYLECLKKDSALILASPVLCLL